MVKVKFRFDPMPSSTCIRRTFRHHFANGAIGELRFVATFALRRRGARRLNTLSADAQHTHRGPAA
jgi:hypothetical protein